MSSCYVSHSTYKIFFQRCILWTLLGSLIGVSSGVCVVPPNVSSISKSTERFPCENNVCGCALAAHCWDKCCCHSDEEKLQWARINGVTPPEFLVKRVRKVYVGVDREVPKRACCQKSTGKAKSSLELSSEHITTLGSSDVTGEGDSKVEDSAVHTPGILMWKVAECRGLDYFWKLLESTSFIANAIFLGFPPWLLWNEPTCNVVVFGRVDIPDPPVPWGFLGSFSTR